MREEKINIVLNGVHGQVSLGSLTGAALDDKSGSSETSMRIIAAVSLDKR